MIIVTKSGEGTSQPLQNYLYEVFMDNADPNAGVIEKIQENYEFLAAAVARMMAMQLEQDPKLTADKIETILFGEPCGQLMPFEE